MKFEILLVFSFLLLSPPHVAECFRSASCLLLCMNYVYFGHPETPPPRLLLVFDCLSLLPVCEMNVQEKNCKLLLRLSILHIAAFFWAVWGACRPDVRACLWQLKLKNFSLCVSLFRLPEIIEFA